MKKLYSVLFAIIITCLVSCGKGEKNFYIVVKKDGDLRWSILNQKTGEYIARNEFPQAPSLIRNGLFFCGEKHNYQLFSVEDTNNPISKECFDDYTIFDEDGYAIVSQKMHPLQIIKADGKIVTSLSDSIAFASSFKNGYAMVVSYRSYYGFIGHNGELISGIKYRGENPFVDGKAWVKRGYETICINTQGDSIGSLYHNLYNVETPINFSGDYYTADSHYSRNNAGGPHKCCLYNFKGDSIFEVGEISSANSYPYKYVNPSYVYHNKYVTFLQNGNVGIKDLSGNIIVRAQYRGIYALKTKGYFIVNDNGKFGVIDDNNNKIVPAEYSNYVFSSYDDFVLLKKDGIYYVIDYTNGEILCKDIKEIHTEKQGRFIQSNRVNESMFLDVMISTIRFCDKTFDSQGALSLYNYQQNKDVYDESKWNKTITLKRMFFDCVLTYEKSFVERTEYTSNEVFGNNYYYSWGHPNVDKITFNINMERYSKEETDMIFNSIKTQLTDLEHHLDINLTWSKSIVIELCR